MDIVLSGIRSTGKLHLGNYFGASKLHTDAGGEQVLLFIADLHSLTTHPDPKALHENVKNVLIDYLAADSTPRSRLSTCRAM